MVKVNIETKYFSGEVKLTFVRYPHDNSMCIVMTDKEGPVGKATVYIDGHPPPYNYVLLKGWSENEGIPEALEKAGIVKLTGHTVSTGFCEAQVGKLLIDYKDM